MDKTVYSLSSSLAVVLNTTMYSSGTQVSVMPAGLRGASRENPRENQSSKGSNIFIMTSVLDRLGLTSYRVLVQQPSTLRRSS